MTVNLFFIHNFAGLSPFWLKGESPGTEPQQQHCAYSKSCWFPLMFVFYCLQSIKESLWTHDDESAQVDKVWSNFCRYYFNYFMFAAWLQTLSTETFILEIDGCHRTTKSQIRVVINKLVQINRICSKVSNPVNNLPRTTASLRPLVSTRAML